MHKIAYLIIQIPSYCQHWTTINRAKGQNPIVWILTTHYLQEFPVSLEDPSHKNAAMNLKPSKNLIKLERKATESHGKQQPKSSQ